MVGQSLRFKINTARFQTPTEDLATLSAMYQVLVLRLLEHSSYVSKFSCVAEPLGQPICVFSLKIVCRVASGARASHNIDCLYKDSSISTSSQLSQLICKFELENLIVSTQTISHPQETVLIHYLEMRFSTSASLLALLGVSIGLPTELDARTPSNAPIDVIHPEK